jgi:hypothetical protein
MRISVVRTTPMIGSVCPGLQKVTAGDSQDEHEANGGEALEASVGHVQPACG